MDITKVPGLLLPLVICAQTSSAANRQDRMFRLAIVFGLIAAFPGVAFCEKCIPPAFYQSVPRDAEWYYGVGKDPDTDRARDLALINLGKQVTGSLQGADQASISGIAGQGVDRTKAAEMVGQLLPSSTLLAGWEQDDHDRCNGVSYALVRIEKSRVRRFLQEDKRFREDVIRGVNSRVDELKESVTALVRRLDSLEQQNRKALQQLQAMKQGGTPAEAGARNSAKLMNYEHLNRAIQVVRVQLRSGKQPAHAVAALDALEREFNDIRKSVEDSKKIHSESANKAAEKAKADIADGSLSEKDFKKVNSYYLNRVSGRPFDDESWQDLEDFQVSVAEMKRKGFWGYINRDFDKVRKDALTSSVIVAMPRKKWDLAIKLAQNYMTSYPDEPNFAFIEKYMNDAMKNKRDEMARK